MRASIRVTTKETEAKETDSFASVLFGNMCLQGPLPLVGVEQVVGLLRQGGLQIVPVEHLNGGVFMGEADGALGVQLVQVGAPVSGEVLAVVDGLAAAAGAAAGAGHDLHKVVVCLPGAQGVHQLAGAGLAGGHGQTEPGLTDGEGSLPPGLLAPDLLEGVGGGLVPVSFQ